MENPARTGSVMQRDVWARWPRSGYTPWEARAGVLPRPDLGTTSRHDKGFFPRRLRGCPFPCRWPERAACLLTLSRSLEAAPGTGRTLGTVLREPLQRQVTRRCEKGHCHRANAQAWMWAAQAGSSVASAGPQAFPSLTPPASACPPGLPDGHHTHTAPGKGGGRGLPHASLFHREGNLGGGPGASRSQAGVSSVCRVG